MKNPMYFCAGALVLAGCVSMGTRVDQSALSQFQKGVTTEAQVEKALGTPQATGIDSDGNETISYIYSHASAKGVDFVPIVGLFAGGAKGEQTTVIFRFKKGTLVSYSASTGKQDVHAIF